MVCGCVVWCCVVFRDALTAHVLNCITVHIHREQSIEVATWSYIVYGKQSYLYIFQAKTGLDFLIDRREFWSQQRPDYHIDKRENIGKPASWDTVLSSIMKKKTTVFGRKLF